MKYSHLTDRKTATAALAVAVFLLLPCPVFGSRVGGSKGTTYPLKPLQQREPSTADVHLAPQQPAAIAGVVDIFRSGSFSMGGKAYEDGLRTRWHYSDEGRVTFFIPNGTRSLTVDIGVDDAWGKWQDDPARFVAPYYSVLIEGKLVKGGEGEAGVLSYGKPPISLELDVTGKRSVQFILGRGAGVGEPIAHKRASSAQAMEETSAAPRPVGKIPKLVSPADKTQVSGETVMLRWQPIDGAVSYGVTVISTKSADSASPETPRIWSATVKGSSYALPLAALQNGQYVWTVIAFGPSAPLGRFSEERSIVVDKG